MNQTVWTIADRAGRFLTSWRMWAPVAAVIFLAGGFYTVNSDETAVVTRFGAVVNPGALPGLHFEPLWPFATITKVNIQNYAIMSVGYKELDLARGVPPQPEESEFLTSDSNLIDIRIRLQYQVTDPVAYLYGVERPMFVIRRLAEAHLTRMVGRMPVDEVLTTGQTALTEDLRTAVQSGLDRLGIGLRVGQASILGVEPPLRVKPSFQDVVDARADKNRMVLEARSDANKLLPAARGEVSGIVTRAASDKDRRIAMAKGQAERFSALYAQYRKDPRPREVKERMYLETLTRVLPRAKRILADSEHGTSNSTLTIVDSGPNESSQ